MCSLKFLYLFVIFQLSRATISLDGYEKANVMFFYGKNSATFNRYKASQLTQLLSHPYFDYNRPTVIYIFGWTQSPFSDSTKFLIESYLNRADHNVLMLDWSDSSVRPLYTSMFHVSKIARIFGRAFTKVFNKGLNVGNFHCVGHSFGCHACGIMGREVMESSRGYFKFPRITGLDCARLGFIPKPLYELPLSRKDAHFVDIIQTDNFFIGGTWEPIGHASFFVNNATLQPGCPKLEFNDIYDTLSIWCSHYRAIDYYALTLNPQFATFFIGQHCPNYELFQNGWCRSNPTNVMGFYSRPDIPGKFYVEVSYAPSSFDRKRNFFYTANRIKKQVHDVLSLRF